MIGEVLGALAAFAAVEAVLLVARPTAYLSLAFPLPVEPLPLSALPEGAGRTATVTWDVQGDVAPFVAHGGGLLGLHGVVRFVRDRRGVRLAVGWAPPWTLLPACAAVAILGADRGVPWLSVPLSLVLFAGGLLAYQQAAIRAAAEIRFAWSDAE